MKHTYSPKDIINSGLCIGCGSCVAQSLRNDLIMQFDKYGQFKPAGPVNWQLRPSESFSETCPFSPSALNEDDLAGMLFPDTFRSHVSIGRYMNNFVGHVIEDDFRLNGSSGGMVSWVATQLFRKGLIDGVAHVVATQDPQKEEKFFKFHISRTEEELRDGAKSRYYPVEMSEILKTIYEVPGRYALIAVPCMIKAVQLLRKKYHIFEERICFTLGLFCGHMKSAKFVESFAWQMKVSYKELKKVDFRYKYPNRPANWYNAMLELKNGKKVNKDWWHLVDGDWGAGFFMNSACNFCDDVVGETADVSFGDAWIEPYSSDGRGTNVVVVRSELIKSIIDFGLKGGKLQLEEVDAELIEKTQAAGLRQRREGLSYRLFYIQKEIKPEKRVPADDQNLTKTRKQIYRMRYMISKWSHRIFWLARILNFPYLYLFWARVLNAYYYGKVYHKGKLKEIKHRFRDLKIKNSKDL